MRNLAGALLILGSLAACGADDPAFIDGSVGVVVDAAASVDGPIDGPVDAMVDRTPATFFGNGQPDQDAAGVFPDTGSEAAAQRAAFMARLNTSASETFESAPLGVPPDAQQVTTLPSFSGWSGGGNRITQEISGLASFNVAEVTSTELGSSGRFNTTPGADGVVGDGRWWDVASPFTLNLVAPAQAVGFYLTDVGDFGSSLTIELFLGATRVGSLVVPHVQGASGNLAFFGRVDPTISFDRIVFALAQAAKTPQDSYDHVGFDDVVVGRVD